MTSTHLFDDEAASCPYRHGPRDSDGATPITPAADWMERDPNADVQHVLLPETETGPAPRKRTRAGRRRALIGGGAELPELDAAALDRVHAAMLLRASGRGQALRRPLKAGQDRGPDFLRFANTLSALYPSPGEERRLLDAMLLAAPG